MDRTYSRTESVLAANEGSATIISMWLPRFTLRSALWGVTLCAFVALLAGQAVAGQVWAISIVIAIGGCAFFFIVYAAIYSLLRLLPVTIPADSLPAAAVRTNISIDEQPQRSPA